MKVIKKYDCVRLCYQCVLRV